MAQCSAGLNEIVVTSDLKRQFREWTLWERAMLATSSAARLRPTNVLMKWPLQATNTLACFSSAG
jgi:hypothetical protein